MEVIPAINGTTLKEARAQIMTVAPFADWIHIDVADGIFTRNITWGKPNELHELIESSNLTSYFEIHLMVTNPEIMIEPWLNSGAKRVVVHVEVMSNPMYVLEQIKEKDAQVTLAVKPDTPIERLLIYKEDFPNFQILAVEPGLAGQTFQNSVVEKIKALRERAPDATIEVDGGINPDTARLCKEAGATALVSASYVFGSKDPRTAYEMLRAV